MSHALAKGIDVSKHQGVINWASVKNAGIQFAILRAGYGRVISQKDKQFEANYKGAKAAEIPVGVYWYSYATTVAEAKQEASVCLQAIAGKQFEYPIYFDQEYEPAIVALSNAQRTELVKAFCDTVENAGYYVGLYCSRDWLNNKLDHADLKDYAVWVAAYSASMGSVKLPCGIWQYSSKGSVPGIAGNVDLDYAYLDYPTAIKAVGLNGFSVTGRGAFPDLGTLTLKTGSKGTVVKNLQTVLNALGFACGTTDGIYGTRTTIAVKNAQKAYKLVVDGLCGNKTKAALKAVW